MTKEQDEHNDTVTEEYHNQSKELVIKLLLPWLQTHLEHRDALRSGERVEAFGDANEFLIHNLWINSFDAQLRWFGEIVYKPDGQHTVPRNDWKDVDDELFDKLSKEYTEMVFYIRMRVCLLVLLCDGLYKYPVLVPSGEQKPRLRARHIVHPAQSEHDALAEFAKNMVNPPQRFVAHVRLPDGYHLVQLASPLAGPKNTAQLQQVRLRSQERYHRPESTGEAPPAPGAQPGSQFPPAIGRRPGEQQQPSGGFPEDDEDAS